MCSFKKPKTCARYFNNMDLWTVTTKTCWKFVQAYFETIYFWWKGESRGNQRSKLSKKFSCMLRGAWLVFCLLETNVLLGAKVNDLWLQLYYYSAECRIKLLKLLKTRCRQYFEICMPCSIYGCRKNAQIQLQVQFRNKNFFFFKIFLLLFS